MPRSRRFAILAMVLAIGCEPDRVIADPSEPITPIALADARVEGADGTAVELDLRGRPHLIHFWATWCAPCRDELPALLAGTEREGGARAITAVSMDGSWAPVRRFFDGSVPESVVREPAGTLARQLGVTTLPDTYLIDTNGNATRRVHGARDWRSENRRRWLANVLSDPHVQEEEPNGT